MAKKRQSSVIRRVYAGFAVLAISLIATNTLNLNNSQTIHGQLETVTSEASRSLTSQMKPALAC